MGGKLGQCVGVRLQEGAGGRGGGGYWPVLGVYSSDCPRGAELHQKVRGAGFSRGKQVGEAETGGIGIAIGD